jgi:hypothetical protein
MQSIISLIKKINKKYIFLTVVAIIIIIILVYLVSKKNEHFGVDNFKYNSSEWNPTSSSPPSATSTFSTPATNEVYRFGDSNSNSIYIEKLFPVLGMVITQSATYFGAPAYFSTSGNYVYRYASINTYNPKYWRSIGVEGGTITNTAGIALNSSTLVRYGIIKTSSSIYRETVVSNSTITATNYGGGIIPPNPNNNLYIYQPPPSGTLSGPLAVKSIIINNKFATDYMYYDFNQGKTVNGGRPLQISQLAVYAMVGSNLINVAATSNGGVASAFSSFPGLNPSHAIDGTLSPKVFSGNAYHSSGGGNNEWWYLELNNTYNVHRIVYYNRSECCQIRAKGSQIELFSTNQTDKVDTSFPIYSYTFDESLVQEITIFSIPTTTSPPTTTLPTTTRPTTTLPTTTLPTTTLPTTTRPTTTLPTTTLPTTTLPTTTLPTTTRPTTTLPTTTRPTTTLPTTTLPTTTQPTTTRPTTTLPTTTLPTTTQPTTTRPTTTQPTTTLPTTTLPTITTGARGAESLVPTTTGARGVESLATTTTGARGAEVLATTTTGALGAESLATTTTGAQGAEALATTTTGARCDSRPTTSNNSLMDILSSDMNMLMRDIQSNIPRISSAHVIDLVNSGIDINTLTPSFIERSRDSNGNTNYKYQDPSIEINEVEFGGSSNVYSPYLYYDKNSLEKFDSVKNS